MKDRTGYPIRLGSFVRAPGVVGFSHGNPGGRVESFDWDQAGPFLRVRTLRGLRALRTREVEVVHLTPIKAKRPLWVRRLSAADSLWSRKPERRGRIASGARRATF